jgi:hypothetical protein
VGRAVSAALGVYPSHGQLGVARAQREREREREKERERERERERETGEATALSYLGVTDDDVVPNGATGLGELLVHHLQRAQR